MEKVFNKQELRKNLESELSEEQVRRIFNHSFLDLSEINSFNEWKNTFIGAFLMKYPDKPIIVKMICDALDKKSVLWEDFSRVNINRITTYIKANLAPNSAATYLAIIKSVLNDFSEEGVIPCKSIKKLLKGEKSPSQHISLTEDELYKLDAYIPKSEAEQDVKTLFMIACLTGCRSSDAKMLTEDNVVNDNLSYVSKKTKTEVNLPIHKLLRKYLATKIHKDRSTAVIIKTIQRICKHLGFNEEMQLYVGGKLKKGQKWEFITMHTARRTFCTILATKNVPIEMIKTLAGHSSSTMTDRYICLDGKKPGASAMAFFRG